MKLEVLSEWSNKLINYVKRYSIEAKKIWGILIWKIRWLINFNSNNCVWFDLRKWMFFAYIVNIVSCVSFSSTTEGGRPSSNSGGWIRSSNNIHVPLDMKALLSIFIVFDHALFIPNALSLSLLFFVERYHWCVKDISLRYAVGSC